MNINLITPRSTTLAILFLSFFPTIFEFLKPFITLFCILVLGIPHGALDHILYYKLASGAIPDSNGSQDSEAFHHFGKDGENPSTELPITKSEQSKIITFYGNYLAIMGLWAGCWAMFPDLAFWGFLTLSCYHFGEGDLDYLTGLGANFKTTMYISRGIYVVGLTMTSQPEITRPIVQNLIQISDSEFYKLCQTGLPIIIIQHILVLWRLSLLCIFDPPHLPIQPQPFPTSSKPLQWSTFLSETLKSSIYLLMYTLLDPLTAFSIFFGVWHSSTTIYHSIIYLTSTLTPTSIIQFYRLATPYSLISYLGMGLVYSVVEIDVNIWAIFVGCISVLTGPHMWVIGAGHGVVGLDPIGSVLRTVKDGLRI